MTMRPTHLKHRLLSLSLSQAQDIGLCHRHLCLLGQTMTMYPSHLKHRLLSLSQAQDMGLYHRHLCLLGQTMTMCPSHQKHRLLFLSLSLTSPRHGSLPPTLVLAWTLCVSFRQRIDFRYLVRDNGPRCRHCSPGQCYLY